MSYAFQFKARISVLNPPGVLPSSGSMEEAADVLEAMSVSDKAPTTVDLSSDAPVSVPFSGCESAHVVFLRVLSGSAVVAAITTALGAAQLASVDPVYFGMSSAKPATAITLTRTAGVATRVQVLLCEATL